MKLLALETATQACSVALLIDGAVTQRYEVQPRAHTRLVLPMVEALLSEAGVSLAQLDLIAFACGPGGFTGIRIGAGVAQGLGLGAGLPVLPVSSLATLAQGGFRRHGRRNVLACVDARMDEVYWGAFAVDEHEMVQGYGAEALSAPAQVTCPTGAIWFGVGSGWSAHPQLARRLGTSLEGVDATLLPTAADVATLAATQAHLAVSPEEAQPVYLRNEVAWRKLDRTKTPTLKE